MNDVQFSDTPISTGTVADFCERFPNSPACTRLSPGNGSGNGHGNDNHGHHHNGGNHHGGDGHGGNNHHHPLS